jgi:hypothetical protein
VPLPYYITHGITASLQRVDTRQITFSRRDVDRVEDAWRMPAVDTLMEGDPHPDLPGCIIDELRVTGPFGEDGRLVWMAEATSLGDARGTQPTKILARGKSRTIEGGWDQRTVRYLSWHADWRGCTAVASTDIVTTLAANGFITGQRVMFARLTGGAGISSQGTSSLGTVYFWRRLSSTTGTLHTTAGGAAANTGLVDITTDMTAGEIIAAEFALGAPHPDHATMYLAELQLEDENNDWKTANVTYRGLEESKPFHRMISVNGQSFSSGDKMTVSLAGGWGTPRYTNVHLPEVVVTDTYLTGSTTLPTSSVPAFETPPNAPAITSIVLEGDAERLIYNYPYGWTLVSAPHAATLNYLINAMTYQKVYRYIHPVMIR